MDISKNSKNTEHIFKVNRYMLNDHVISMYSSKINQNIYGLVNSIQVYDADNNMVVKKMNVEMFMKFVEANNALKRFISKMELKYKNEPTYVIADGILIANIQIIMETVNNMLSYRKTF